jgi:hypothetical protein
VAEGRRKYSEWLLKLGAWRWKWFWRFWYFWYFW